MRKLRIRWLYDQFIVEKSISKFVTQLEDWNELERFCSLEGATTYCDALIESAKEQDSIVKTCSY